MARIIARSTATTTGGAVPRGWRESTRSHAGPLDAAAARARAARILLDARVQARAIMTGAQETIQEVAAAECEQARERGYAEGLEQARQSCAAIVQRLSTLVAGAAVAHEESVRNLDETVLDLVTALTRVIVRHEVTTAPETILAVARAALGELTLDTTVLLRVHPDDEAVVRGHLDLLRTGASVPPSVRIEVASDPTVSPGGCLIESGAARVDATVETQVERAHTLLREVLDAS